MAKAKLFNQEGKEIKDITLADSVFGLPANDDLVHQVMVAISGNKRQVLAHTKNRGERAGSGIKPWRQKGTGRARVGSVRTPVWRKGGVVFGPRNDRNFSRKINKKMNSLAIAVTLSGKLRDGELMIVDKLETKEKKTKKMAEILKNLKIKGKILMAFSDSEKDLKMISRNIENVNNIMTSQLNVLDMLNNKNLLMSQESVKFLEEKYKKGK
ncbi:MAG TPA: 50S ribosomal protein L4 [Candidatus Moranbacteria bacterium]|nr:50S ribosomal protein L4 [Candidatus Moranbacteria bacterium]